VILILCNNPTVKIKAKTVIKYTYPHERDIAYYLKQDKNHYIRYRVTPIFKGNNLLAQGFKWKLSQLEIILLNLMFKMILSKTIWMELAS
jgi:hypothetical protein